MAAAAPISVDNPFPQAWGPPTSYATRQDKIVCVMVGLPARGKSYVARRLAHYVAFFYGMPSKIFNVAEYRQKRLGGNFQPADFFDFSNEANLSIRKEVAEEALRDLCAWLQESHPTKRRKSTTTAVSNGDASQNHYVSGEFGAFAIYDATNVTNASRIWVEERLKACGAKVIFVEAICNDAEMIRHNIQCSKFVAEESKESNRLSPAESATDFEERMLNYSNVYETVTDKDKCWIKLVDGGREVAMNNIRGFLPSRIGQFLMNLHLHRRPFYFSRHGQSEYNRLGKVGGDSGLTEHGEEYAEALASWVKEHVLVDGEGVPQPARLWTSSLQRTIRTARHISHEHIILPNGMEWVQMRPKMFRNLDEIYAGICDGMTYEEISQKYPEEAKARKADKFEYRYPRGESYTDLIARLEPIAHELERQREPLLVVAHQAILRVLYAYLLGLPREACPEVSIPLNTVIKITPTSTGCDVERFTLLKNISPSDLDPASH